MPLANTPMARALYAKRSERGLTLHAAAKQARLTLTTFHRLETQRRPPTVGVLLKAARWLGMEPGTLVKLGVVVALLLPAVPAHAENFYAYGQQVLIAPPVVTHGPGSARVTFHMDEYAIIGTPYLKSCQVWTTKGRPEYWDGMALVMDEDVVLYGSGANYPAGEVSFTVGDRRAGRVQTWCLRLPYVLP